jgi:prevent-host-death family protein
MSVRDVTLADAKARLSALVEQAMHGDPVRITRRGKPVAQITAIQATRKPVDIAALRALTDTMRARPVATGDWLRRSRDEERY